MAASLWYPTASKPWVIPPIPAQRSLTPQHLNIALVWDGDQDGGVLAGENPRRVGSIEGRLHII